MGRGQLLLGVKYKGWSVTVISVDELLAHVQRMSAGGIQPLGSGSLYISPVISGRLGSTLLSDLSPQRLIIQDGALRQQNPRLIRPYLSRPILLLAAYKYVSPR